MATLTGGFEVAGATNGQVIATSDAGDADAWTNVTIGGSATAAYDTGTVYNGSKAAKFATAGASTTTQVRWGSAKFTAITDHYGRAYIWIPTVGVTWINANDIVKLINGVSSAATIGIDATGHIIVKDQGGTIRATAATALAGGAWVRIEWHIVHSTTVGSITVTVFVGGNIGGATADYTVTASSINTLAQADEIRFGLLVAAANAGPIYFDRIVGHSTTAVGPLGTSWTGASSFTATASMTTAGTRKTFGSTSMTEALGVVTTGKLGAKSSSASTFTLGVTTAGTRKTFGMSASTTTLAVATAGTRTTFGVSAVTETLNITTAGTRGSLGASASTTTVTISTAGYPTKFAASSSTYTLATATAGTRTTFGDVILTETVTITTVAAGVLFLGAASATFTLTITTIGSGNVYAAGTTGFIARPGVGTIERSRAGRIAKHTTGSIA